MKKVLMLGCLFHFHFFVSAQDIPESGRKLPKELREISGIHNEGDDFWAIADDASSDLYRVARDGSVRQHIKISNVRMNDIEAVSSDKRYVYLGDIGDNAGVRESREIIRVSKRDIDKSDGQAVMGEKISFIFPDEGIVKKKKSNNFDCEAMVVSGDSIYVFTKRRDDLKTGLYALPAKPGMWTAREVSLFKSKGMVTDAALNDSGNELALIGYEEGHTRPFLYVFTDFKGKDFFSGTHKRYDLDNSKNLDWQVESVSFAGNDEVFIACERTKDVPASLYKVNLGSLKASGK